MAYAEFPRVVAWLLGVIVLAAAAASCGGTGTTKTPGPAPPVAIPLRQAPEPAVSPPAAGHLPGVVMTLAGQPEGVAIDTEGLVGVNVRRPDGLVWFPISAPGRQRFLATRGSARHLTLGAAPGTFLVPDESDNTLVEVALPVNRVLESVRVGHQPHDAVAVGRATVFVADELASTLHIIRGATVVRVVKAPLQPGGMAVNAAGTRVLVVGVRGRRIVEYDTNGDVIGAANCGAGPTHAVTGDDGRYWVADTNGDAVLGFEMGAHGPIQVATIPVGPRPYGIAFDARRDILWVTTTGNDQLVGLHLHAATVTSRTIYDTPRQPNTVAVDQSSGEVVVATATRVGVLQFLHPAIKL